MSNVVEFPTADPIAEMFADFAKRARDGEFVGSIVIALHDDGFPEFGMNISGAGTISLLAAVGALDVIRARLVKVIEASVDSTPENT